MLVYLYIFSLIVGGVLLAASMLLGGNGDADAGAAELEADTDADSAHHAPGLAKPPLDVQGGPDLLWFFRSTRFWTFFLAFFGLAGLVVEGLGLANALVTLPLAVLTGLVAGYPAAWVMRWLIRTEVGSAAGSSEYVGRTARVLVPVLPGAVGKVRLTLRGTTVDVLAVTDEAEGFRVREEALIIDLEGDRVRLARVPDDSNKSLPADV